MASGAEQHFKETHQRLLENCDSRKGLVTLYYSLIAYALEQIGDYLVGESNIVKKEKRQKYDGQKRKRKDGTKYQRKMNCIDSADAPGCIVSSEDYYDDVIDDTLDLFAVSLSDDEKLVLHYLLDKVSMADIERQTYLTYKQIRNIRENLKLKMLVYLKIEQNYSKFEFYKNYCKDFCKKFKKFEKKRAKSA